MSALDRISIVPLMFQALDGALASDAGHAKVTAGIGGHACRPLAGEAGQPYLSGSPILKPNSAFAAAPASAARAMD